MQYLLCQVTVVTWPTPLIKNSLADSPARGFAYYLSSISLSRFTLSLLIGRMVSG